MAATRASRSPSPGNDRGRTIPVTFGLSSRDSFAYYDPDVSCWRTSQATLLSDSTPCSLTLPKWGMTRGGDAFELPTPELRTDGNGSLSLLGTPSAADAMGGHLSRGGDRSHELLLKGQVKALLPTPTVGDSKSAANKTAGRLDPDSHHHAGTTLTDAARLLPTDELRLLGEPTSPPSDDGNTSSDSQHPGQLTTGDA